MADLLYHVTLNTGHLRWSPRAEVQGETIDILTPILRAAMTAPGEAVPIVSPSGADFGESLVVEGQGARWILMRIGLSIAVGVAAHSRAGAALWRRLHRWPLPLATSIDDVPPEPWCAARIDTYELDPERMGIYGDLERCLAWTWLDMQ